jgi:hypothetical protein
MVEVSHVRVRVLRPSKDLAELRSEYVIHVPWLSLVSVMEEQRNLAPLVTIVRVGRLIDGQSGLLLIVRGHPLPHPQRRHGIVIPLCLDAVNPGITVQQHLIDLPPYSYPQTDDLLKASISIQEVLRSWRDCLQ